MSSVTTGTVSVGVNISSAASFYSHTVATTGPHRFQVFLDNAAGNGDYVFYLKRQRLGAGTAYPELGKTTVTAASGETAFVSPTITIDATATDVIAVWIDGLAGDTAVTGSVEIWVDDYTKTADILTTALTESYAADSAAPTLSQAIFAIQQFLQERIVSGTTVTVKKIDGSTTAMTFTLSDATSPTSITRST